MFKSMGRTSYDHSSPTKWVGESEEVATEVWTKFGSRPMTFHGPRRKSAGVSVNPHEWFWRAAADEGFPDEWESPETAVHSTLPVDTPQG